MLGGRTSTTLVPAELLRLPREPKEGAVSEPFDKDGAREKELAMAKESADAIITGMIERTRDIHVVLHVVDRAGHERASAEGTDPSVPGAIRAATDGLRAKGVFGLAPDLAYLHSVLPGASVDAALGFHDLAVFDLMEDDVDVKADCGALVKRTDLGAMGTLVLATCATPLGNPSPAELASDDSTPIASAITVAVLRRYPAQSAAEKAARKARIDALVASANKEPDQELRSVLLGAAADGYYFTVSDAAAAASVSRASVQASPRVIDLRGTAWHRQSFTSADLGAPVLIAHESWAPWEPFAQANLYLQLGTHAEFASAIRRAAILARHGYWQREYGEWLVRIGHLEEAKGIAVESGSPFLAALIKYAEGFSERALAQIRRSLAETPLSGPEIYRTEGVREQLALAFMRAGENDMAERLDEYWLPDEVLPEANAAHVRSVLRLEKRGDVVGARRVAQAYVRRWNIADERPRGIEEMKRLLARTASQAADGGAK